MSDALATGSVPAAAQAPAASTAAASAVQPPARPPVSKIIVAIHGIGSQQRSSTIRSVARRFGDRSEPPLPVMPLGFFHIDKAGEVHVSRLDAESGSPLQRVGFAEVFWADIPRQVVNQDDTLEETKAWGASVVSRAEATYRQKVTDRPLLASEDFSLAAGVVDEIVETVGVLENLLAVAEKMGVFKFELAPLLRDYIGDVQIVTEFGFFRQKIVSRFHAAMAQIIERYDREYPGAKPPEIYVVAHSEGTVVSFLGLLEALSGRGVCDPDTPATPISTDWIRNVRGFMTIGSPIDKHLVLWPRIWEGLDLKSRRLDGGEVVFERDGKERLRLPGAIAWRNYYDYGDPIGFRLETAARHLALNACQAFDFASDGKKDDFGFSRYWLPGKAHNDYWGDPDVFGHFIDDVVIPVGRAVPPTSHKAVGIVSTAVPYLLALLLHGAAVFVLYKAVTAFLAPGSVSNALALRETGLQVLLLGLLMAGITVAARLPRLVKTSGWRWHGVALLAFVVAALPNWFWLPDGVGDFLGRPFLFLADPVGVPAARSGVAALLLAAALVSAIGWWLPRRPGIGRRTLIGCGALVVLVMVAGRLVEGDSQQPAWPVVLAGAAFLYLWWLGILLFDLAFVWHRYIRNSVAVQALGEWQRGRDAWPKVTLRKKPAGKA